ncbi:MAG TPA: ABC transporter permease [Longimicrobiales bacterium]|nr:ABC transporter permease [Longimicrobiales bacterium]
MFRYISGRILIGIPILFLVITIVFFAFRLIPGDAARIIAGDEAPIERVEQIRRDLGLDRPAIVQYGAYLAGLARGDLGTSFSSRRPVATEIGSRYWNTFSLALAAITVATVVGVAMGVISALFRGRWADHLVTVAALLGISIPVFWLGLLLMQLFAVELGWLPAAGYGTWQHFVMPTITLSVFSIAFITRMTRSSLLETVQQDYVRTARAKGVRERLVLFMHSLRNALLPVTIVVGLRFGYMVGGAVITEEVFAWPGLGRLLILSVAQRDIPVVQGLLLVFATSFVVVNLLVDVLYAFLDPRIRHR